MKHGNTIEIAFLEKVFLRNTDPNAHLRGVELFNLNLIKDLTASGHGVLLPIHPSWEPVVRRFAGDGLVTRHVRGLGIPALACLAAGIAIAKESLRHGAFSTIFLANDVNGTIPTIRLLRLLRSSKNTVLFAHKQPSRHFMSSVAKLNGSIVCVCSEIADEFRNHGTTAKVYADYGITNAQSFFPAVDRTTKDDKVVNFCLLGDMESYWKGSDTAIEAYQLLSPELRARAKLHIKAFSTKHDIQIDGIIQHPWTGPDQVPAFLRDMDVMLVPSRRNDKIGRMGETFSQTTVQGMLTALPVVHTSISPLAEKFDVGGGILADSPQEFADAMAKLITNRELRLALGDVARRTALERYVWDTNRFYERYMRAPSHVTLGS